MKLLLCGWFQCLLMLFAGQDKCVGQVKFDTTAGKISDSISVKIQTGPIIERRFVKYFVGNRK